MDMDDDTSSYDPAESMSGEQQETNPLMALVLSILAQQKGSGVTSFDPNNPTANKDTNTGDVPPILPPPPNSKPAPFTPQPQNPQLSAITDYFRNMRKA